MEENNNQLSVINNDIKKRTRYFVRALFFFSIFSIVIFGILVNGEPSKATTEKPAHKQSYFDNIPLEARAVLVWDVVNRQEIFSKNPDLALPLASLTKVMTAITANQVLTADDSVTIRPEDLLPDGDSKLVVGDKWQAHNLIDFVLITSSNDGAHALARASEEKMRGTMTDFITKMNDTANFVGAENSHFWNEHGLDQGVDRGGAYGSARDLALIFEYALKQFPALLEATRYSNLSIRSSASVYNAMNTNSKVDQIPGILASKTGYTDLAGGNLVIAFDAGLNHPIIVAVLGSSQEGRFEDTLKLVEATMKFIKN